MPKVTCCFKSLLLRALNLGFQKFSIADTGNLSPSAFASTIEAAWGVCSHSVGPCTPQSTCLLSSRLPPVLLSSLPTFQPCAQVVLEAQALPWFSQPQQDFSTKVWTSFSPISTEYCEFYPNALSPELSAVFLLDSFPKAFTVLRKAAFPTSGEPSEHWNHGVGVRGSNSI